MRKFLVVLALSILLLCFLRLHSNQNYVKAPNGNPVHNLDTGLDYSTIQSAIDASETQDGHTIFVEEGTYHEHVVVRKALSLLGENGSTTIIDGNRTGIVLTICANKTTVSGLTLRNGTHGIDIAGIHTHANLVVNMVITNMSGDGIMLRQPYGNIITDNKVSDIGAYGVFIMYATNNLIVNNTITSSSYGIYIEGWHENIIRNNIIANNVYGVCLDGTDRNIISCNTIGNNEIGVEARGEDNIIFHNNLINNSKQVTTQSQYWRNIWEDGYPSGGNYWSDYNGADPDYDGIGDYPYVIDDNNQDNYPLIGVFSSFNTSYGYAVDFISNSTISNVSFDLSYIEAYPEEAMLAFNVSGDIDTDGFLRVRIPKILINDSYVITFDSEIITNTTYPQVRELPCSNEAYEYLYINYTHSEHTIEISGTTVIPDFPSFLILLLLMVATVVVALVYQRKRVLMR